MPRRVVKIISAVGRAASPKKIAAKSRRIVRRMAQGTLLAVTLAATQSDTEETPDKKRLFDAGLLDRLRAPLTRIHE
jgi:predicted SnoaL-like aldol condensation-catalyzing enzyme